MKNIINKENYVGYDKFDDLLDLSSEPQTLYTMNVNITLSLDCSKLHPVINFIECD